MLTPTDPKSPFASKTLWSLAVALFLLILPGLYLRVTGDKLPEGAADLVSGMLTMTLGAAAVGRLNATRKLGWPGNGPDDPTLLPQDSMTDADHSRDATTYWEGKANRETMRGAYVDPHALPPAKYLDPRIKVRGDQVFFATLLLSLTCVGLTGCVSKAEYVNAIVTLDRATTTIRSEHKAWTTAGRVPPLTPTDTALRLKLADEYDAAKSELLSK